MAEVIIAEAKICAGWIILKIVSGTLFFNKNRINITINIPNILAKKVKGKCSIISCFIFFILSFIFVEEVFDL